jgi:hypothetical protein
MLTNNMENSSGKLNDWPGFPASISPMPGTSGQYFLLAQLSIFKLELVGNP